MEEFDYRFNLSDVDWAAFKQAMAADDWDNGRTPAQYEESYKNSYAALIVYLGDEIVGTARVLSDGVCNAYVVDVWTHSRYRRQGIATRMMELLLEQLPGQHVYLFTDEYVSFYESLGFKPWEVGMGKVIGKWLEG